MVFPHQHSEPRRQHARGQNLSTPSVFQESWREKEEKKEKKESHPLLSFRKQRSVSVLQRLIGEVLYLYIFSDHIHVLMTSAEQWRLESMTSLWIWYNPIRDTTKTEYRLLLRTITSD